MQPQQLDNHQQCKSQKKKKKEDFTKDFLTEIIKYKTTTIFTDGSFMNTGHKSLGYTLPGTLKNSLNVTK